MKNSDATFTAEKNKLVNRPVWLFTLHNYNGSGTDLHYAEWDSDITFDGVTYTKMAIKHDFTSSNTSGSIDSIRVTVGNAGRVIHPYLELYDFRGKKVTIQCVFLDQIGSAASYIKDMFYIDSITATDESVTFNLSSKFDILNVNLPNRIYMRGYCAWKFKGTECRYSGAETTCNKTAEACSAMAAGSNYQRFGGFPSVPYQPIYVV